MTDNETKELLAEKSSNSVTPTSFDRQWKYASAFTIRQAAYLWGGHEPQEKYSMGLHIRDDGTIGKTEGPASLAANIQMLKAAILVGKITPIFQVFSDLKQPHEDDQISRENLEAFANEIGQLPEFLFDTVLSDTESDEPEADSGLSDQPSFADKGGGRPSKYHWNKIAGLVAFMEGEVGLADKSNIEIVRMIQDKVRENPTEFCEKGRGVPDPSSIDRRIGKMLDALRELRDENNERKNK